MSDITPGGEGTPLYEPYRYMPPQRVGFCRRFGLKTGIHFAHFGLEPGMVFEGTTGVYKLTYHFNSKREKKKEKYANLKWILRNHFCWCSDLGKDDNFLEARSENGCKK